MSGCPPCQRMSSLRRADSPSCGLPCDSTRSTSPMRSTDFCFPLLLSTTSTRAAFVPSISSRLAPRPFALGLHPGRGRLGDLAVQDAGSASAGGSGFSRGVSSSACSRCYRASDTPVANPWPSPRLREARFRRASRDRAGMRSVKSRTPLRSRMPSIASLPPCAGRTHSRERSREVSASMRVPVFLRPPLRTCVRWSCELGARP
jgi:hypothetical protein